MRHVTGGVIILGEVLTVVKQRISYRVVDKMEPDVTGFQNVLTVFMDTHSYHRAKHIIIFTLTLPFIQYLTSIRFYDL